MVAENAQTQLLVGSMDPGFRRDSERRGSYQNRDHARRYQLDYSLDKPGPFLGGKSGGYMGPGFRRDSGAVHGFVGGGSANDG